MSILCILDVYGEVKKIGLALFVVASSNKDKVSNAPVVAMGHLVTTLC
jgi:hypothetical protein